MYGFVSFTASLLFGTSLLLDAAIKGAHKKERAFRTMNIIAWMLICVYAYVEASQYASEGEEFDAIMSIFFVLFGVFTCFLFVFRWSDGARHTFLTLTRVAFIASVVYFTFAEIPFMNNLIIYGTASLTSRVLNFITHTYTEYPANIYTQGDFHKSYGPVTIILACTAIQSMALFAGLTLGVSAHIKRRIIAFLISVPVIYVLNILRNVFVCAAYFENWFESLGCTPIESFDIAHDYIARSLTLLSLFIIAYAVFMILPEALSFVDDFLKIIRRDQSPC